MPSFVAFDLETTGLDPKNDAIIEVAFVRVDETGVVERWSTLVNPGFPLPEETVNITGITDEDLKDAPFFSDLRPRILEFLADDVPLLGHNVDFDVSFLREYGFDLGGRTLIDTFRLSQVLFYEAKSLNLGSLLESLGVPYEGQHRALADTEATVKLFELCQTEIEKLPKEKQSILSFLSNMIPRGSAFGYVLTNAGFPREMVSIDQIQELVRTRRKAVKELTFFSDDMCSLTWQDILNKGGSVALEERPEQAKMLDLATHAFAERELLLIEAPTGIGKTFAYGVPSILTSIRTGKPVFISTNTKTLQDQIFDKDIPMLQDMFREAGIADFSVAKIKGRSNYLSLLLFLEYVSSDLVEEQEFIFAAKILFWLMDTEYGELEELSFYGAEYGYLERIRATDRRVLIPENPFRKEEFLYRVRQDANNANIVIMNHSLLLAEVESEDEAKILPDLKFLVIDEAHNLEAVATDALKQSISLQAIESALDGIELIMKKQKKTPTTEVFLFPEFRDIRESLVLNFGMLFDIFYRYLALRVPQSGDNKYNQTLLEADFFRQDFIVGGGRILDALSERIHACVSFLYSAPEGLYTQMNRHISTLEGGLRVVETLFREKETKYIKVVSMNAGDISVSMTPLHVGSILETQLYHKLDACIATSATLAVDGDFTYIEKSLSMQSFQKQILASDFDYSTQALIFIPSDIGDIRDSANRVAINRFIGDIIRAVGGKTLGLFTSFASIKETFLEINLSLKKEGIGLLTQGLSGGRARMIEHFRKNAKSSALFGTDSFWEGVDIPGDDLEILIIYKFPFAVPTDPVFLARSRLYRDSFSEYSLPAMIIKLRQGLGRLIRTKKDRGVIVLLDSRINSVWGETVKKGFPEGIKIRSGNRADFLEMLKKKKM